MRISDWSSDVCSSDLDAGEATIAEGERSSAFGATASASGNLSTALGQGAAASAAGAVALGQGSVADQANTVSVGTTTSQRRIVNVADGRSEEHTSELQSLMRISYAVFCLKKKKNEQHQIIHNSTT